MTHLEKRAWIRMVMATAAYAVYAAIILSRARGHPLTQTPYAAALLWTVVASTFAAMLMAMAGWDRFWIANVVYLCFFLSAVLGGVTKVIACRKPFPQW